MAMLAEPRRKQKWTLNPRGKQWSEDSNKFGQKMLEKMGWTSGKGLGANEQGMTEHVRVKFKDDSAGIGFSKDEQDKYWTEHQENFNDLLQKLHASEEAEEIIVPQEIKKSADLSGKSLELKSKQSRARVHYQKFTRGKDVNKYSTKDLANIFGKRELLGPEKPMEIVEEPKDDILTEPIGAEDTTAGVLTIKGGNMSDYFKSKFPNFHLTPRKPLKDDERDSESECDRRVGFGFTSPSISTFFSLETNKLNHIVDGTPEKTPRKRKSEFYVETPSKTGENSLGSEKSKNSSNSVDHESKIEEHSMRNEENLTKKSKRDKKKTKMEDSVEVQDSSDNDLNSSAKYGSVKNLPSSQQNKSKTKKKKKNREPTECIPQAQDDSESMVNAQGNGSEMPMIKKSKKSPEAENIEVTAEKSKKGKKALKKLSEISGFENPALDLISPDPDPLTKSRRSKRNFDNEKSIEKLSENFVFENPCLDLTSPDSGSSKTSKKNFEVERKLGGLAANLEQLTENFTQNFVFENPALDLDSPGNSVIIKIKNKKRDSRISENMENGGNFEVIREPGVSNEALDLSDESCPKKRVTFNDEVEYNTDSCKKKKLKRKLDKFEVESDRLRKKKIKNETMDGAAFVNEALEIDTVSQEVLENEENEKKDKKSENRRKKRRISNLETITEIPDEEKSLESQGNEVTIEDINGKVGETPPKKKKKKNKKDKNEEKMDNVVKIEDKAENSIDLDKNKENKEDAEMLQSSKKKKVKKDRNKKRESEEEKTGEGVENKVVVESETPKNDRSARSKQKLKHLFAKSPVLHFNGSNINEINGYGVNL